MKQCKRISRVTEGTYENYSEKSKVLQKSLKFQKVAKSFEYLPFSTLCMPIKSLEGFCDAVSIQ